MIKKCAWCRATFKPINTRTKYCSKECYREKRAMPRGVPKQDRDAAHLEAGAKLTFLTGRSKVRPQ